MTLVEIMIVIAIIGMVVVAGVSRLGGSGRVMKQEVRKMAVLGKDLHQRARLLQKTYRLVISMSEESGHQYWVESSADKVKLISEDKRKELEKLTRLQREGLVKTYGFELDSQILKGPRKLPDPLKFKSVEYSQKAAVNKQGKTYIHFFPQGLVEEAAIHLTGGKTLNWTLTYHPVTGKPSIRSKDIPLKELSPYEDK